MAQQGVCRDPILSANFNQDFSCVSIGTERGFSVFNCDPYRHLFTLNDGPRCIVEVLYLMELAVLCGSKDHPHANALVAQIWDTGTQSLSCEFLVPSPILAIRLNRRTLVVVVEIEVFIYDLSNKRLLHSHETNENPKGIIALSPLDSSPYVAFPASTTYDNPSVFDTRNLESERKSALGKVTLFNTDTLDVVCTISAHDCPLSCIAMNQDGTLLSTSSSRGTVIRVWGVPNGQQLYQFRRGSREAEITSMSFNLCSSILAVSSAHITIHLFKLDPKTSLEASQSSSVDTLSSSVSSSLRGLSSHLKRSMSLSVGDYISRESIALPRAFAYLHLPSDLGRCRVGFRKKMDEVLVIADDGYFRVYQMDLHRGGELKLLSYESFAQSIPGRIDTNKIEPEILHWILIEGKDPGSLLLSKECSRRLLDSIQEILASPASKNESHFLIQLLFEIQDDSLVFQYLSNRNTHSITEYLQKVSIPRLGAPDADTESRIPYPLRSRVLTGLRERASALDVPTTHRRLRRLLLRLALEYDQLPQGVHVSGVTCACSESVMCGGFADIYKGEHKGKVVALKRLRVFQMMEPSRKVRVKKAFYHESLVWWNLSHPHVLPLLGISDALFIETPCMVMPWMKEGNIRHVVDMMINDSTRAHNALVMRVHIWLKEISLGLAYLHREEVIHGDLRGVNILINDNGAACLSDFGLAVFAEGRSKNYASLRGGAERWLAPELLHPERFGFHDDRPTYAGDIYSFACVCLELYTGEDPFPGLSQFAVAKHVTDGHRPDRPLFHGHSYMDGDLWSVVNACWTQSPLDRPTAEKLVDWISTV